MAYATAPVSNVLGLGVSLLPMPTSPSARQMDWSASSPSAGNISPFTGSEQILSWPFKARWSCTVTLPMLTRPQVAKWRAWLLSLNGRVNTFQLGDQLFTPGWMPSLTFTGKAPANHLPLNPNAMENHTPLVNGTLVPGTYSVTVRGLPPATPNALMAGDYMQIGYRLHMVTANVTADGTGAAAVSVWPAVRDAATDGTVIDVVHPVGLFRLATDTVQWSSDPDGLTSLSFQAAEVTNATQS